MTSSRQKEQAPELQNDSLLEEVVRGLSLPQKTIPCKYLYDEEGSRLFEEICDLEEYYPTRTELAIMEEHTADMMDPVKEDCLLIELGSGSSRKTRMLLDEGAGSLAAYVPIDISGEHLQQSAEAIRESYPDLEVLPVHADFTQPFEIPRPSRPEKQRVFYFPGSTIGNFDRPSASKLLRQLAERCGPKGGLLLGMDLKKDKEILEHAYNDSEGVTAAFNLNLLHRINRELGANFNVEAFRHRADYNKEEGCIEMFLISTEAQEVQVNDHVFTFAKGERILTERSYKYDIPEVRRWAPTVGFQVARIWTDENQLFCVMYLSRESL